MKKQEGAKGLGAYVSKYGEEGEGKGESSAGMSREREENDEKLGFLGRYLKKSK